MKSLSNDFVVQSCFLVALSTTITPCHAFSLGSSSIHPSLAANSLSKNGLSLSSQLSLLGSTGSRDVTKLYALSIPSDGANPSATTATTTTLQSSIAPSLPNNNNHQQVQEWKQRLAQYRLRNNKKTSSALTLHPSHSWNRQNLKIALPALMGLLADPVLSMVDTGFVGRMGAMDLAALGVCTSIFHMCFTIFRGSTVATTSLMHAAKSSAEKRHICRISLQLAGIMGTIVLLGLRFLGGGTSLLTTMGVSPSSPLYQPACSYLFARAWAAPAVVGIVVAEGAFRGNDDTKTPLIASGVAAILNLVLDPLMMFPMGMGMAGAAAATAISQLGAAGVYGWRLWQRKLLPQPTDTAMPEGTTARIVKSIMGANLSMLAKQGSMLVFYTMATAMATRMGAMHVATHQIALSLFWLVTMWLDSGSISSQMLMGKNLNNRQKVKSLTKYFVKYSLLQGLAFSVIVGGLGGFVPGIFTQDVGIQSMLLQCLPHLAFQQTLVSLVLILEGLAIGGNQFRYMAAGTAVSTMAGMYQLSRATSVVDIWSSAVNTFFGVRLVNAIIGVVRVHMSLKKKEQEQTWLGVDDSNMIESLPETSDFGSVPTTTSSL